MLYNQVDVFWKPVLETAGRSLARSFISTWFWVERAGNSSERVKVTLEYARTHLCERTCHETRVKALIININNVHLYDLNQKVTHNQLVQHVDHLTIMLLGNIAVHENNVLCMDILAAVYFESSTVLKWDAVVISISITTMIWSECNRSAMASSRGLTLLTRHTLLY